MLVEIDEVEEVEEIYKYFSDASLWPDGVVPGEGDEVHIESGWNMILDIEETPIFGLVRVNGQLSFSNETDVHLRANYIFIRAGELLIGSETYPYPNTAKITLYGNKTTENIVYDNNIEAGNKIIANVNVMKMYGKQRTGKVARLTKEAFMNDLEVYVEPNLDWESGDRIAFGPTSYSYDKSEANVVESYDAESGLVVLQNSLLYHHWGAEESTADNYNGVDMRGEVILLSRNIIIAGENIDDWGGQILTTDLMEFNEETFELKFRYGQTILDNVEIYNCS
jgi:hypothetical protein